MGAIWALRWRLITYALGRAMFWVKGGWLWLADGPSSRYISRIYDVMQAPNIPKSFSCHLVEPS